MAQPQLKPTYDDQEPEPQSAYDRARSHWGMVPEPDTEPGQSQDQEDQSNNPNDTSSARERASKAWGMSGGLFANSEGDATPSAGNNLEGALNGAESALSTAAATPANIAANLSPATKGASKVLFKFLGRNVTRKNAGLVGGGVGGLGFLVAIYMAGASLYLVHLKEIFTGDNNRTASAVSIGMRSRRANSLVRILKAGSTKIRAEAFILKAEAAGINVVKDADGKILKLVSENGHELVVNKGAKEMLKDIRALYKGDDAARAFATKIDNVAREVGSRFGGPVVRKKVFENILDTKLRINFIDAWLKDRAARKGLAEVTEEVANAPPENVFAHASAEAGAVEKNIVTNLNPDDILKNTPEGAPVPDVSDIAGDLSDEAEEFNKTIGVDISSPLTKNAGETIKDGAVEAADDIVTTFGAGEKASESALRRIAAKLGPRVTGRIASTLAKLGVDVTTLWREGCRTKGTLSFVNNVRNVFLAIELAKFTYRLYTIADHQKAGLASSTSVKLTSIFMEGATGSSGFQSMLGNGSVSTSSLSAYSTAFGAVGIFAALSYWINKLPGLGPDSCSIATNPLTSIAGSLAGGGLATFTSGSANTLLTGASMSFAIGLTIINEIAFGIITPMMISSVTGALLSGSETPEETGSMATAGTDVINAMSDSANGGLAVKASDFKESLDTGDIFRQDRIRAKSFASRYLDINDTDSLVARTAMYMPLSLPGMGGLLQRNVAIPNFNIASTFNLDKTADAIGENCNDVTAERYDAAMTNFCSPILGYIPLLDIDQTEAILKQTGNITLSGEPVPGSDYEKFSASCFSGRPGIFHPAEFSTDGTTDPVDPTCIPWATEGDFLGTFPGDLPEDIDGNGVERTPTKKERFAAWYGFKADETNLAADINDQLSGSDSSVGQATNNKIYFLGDSLTKGMQSLAGSDQSGDYLQRTFNSKGWNTDVSAQGCRAVYQTQGAFTGDGNSCPGETIIDGLSAVNSDIAKFNNDQMGTVVIGLGTNQYETDSSGRVSDELFEEKVRELINTIKNASPSARIYWVNLTASPSSQSLLDRNTLLLQILGTYSEEQNIVLLDWNDFVKTANATPSTTDDIEFANSVHHTADGYTKKVQYLLDNVALPSNTTSGSAATLSCTGYKELTSPTERKDVSYSPEISSGCEQVKNECLAGVVGTQKILCAAFEFDGTYYGNGYGTYSGAKAEAIYGFNANSSNYGIYAKNWLASRSEGLSPNNLLECSGLASVSLYRAYGVDGSTIGCSGNWTERNNPSKFKQLEKEEISPGDILTISFECNSGGSGHVAIAASTPDENGNLLVYETDSWKRPVRFTKRNLSYFKGGWSRYVGEGAQ